MHIVAFGTKIVYPINNGYFSYNVYFIFKKLSNIFKSRTRYFSGYREKGTVCEGTTFVCRIFEMIVVEMVRNRQVCAPVQYYRRFINKSLRMKCVCWFIFKNNMLFFSNKCFNSSTIINTTQENGIKNLLKTFWH